MFAICLKRAGGDPIAIPVQAGKAPDIHGPEVQGRLTAHHPFGQNPACPAARGNAKGVEPGTHIHVVTFGRGPKDEVAIGGKAFSPVDHLLDARVFQRGHAGDSLFQMLAEMIEVIVKEAEFPIRGNVAGDPALGVRLIPAHHKAADLFLEIGAPIRIAQRGGVGGKAVDLFGDDVLVLDRMQRHRDPGHRAQLARPHAAAVHHLVASDVALGGFHMGDAATVHPEPGDGHPFDDLRAMHPRAFGERLGDVRGARLPVGRQPAGPDQVRGVHQGPHPFDLISADQFHIHPETAGGRGKAFVFGPTVLGGGKAQAARHLPAGIKAGLGGKPFVKIDRVFQHLGD